MGLYLRIKFQVSSIIQTSFRQVCVCVCVCVILLPPTTTTTTTITTTTTTTITTTTSKQTHKLPTQIRVKTSVVFFYKFAMFGGVALTQNLRYICIL